jgi:hypothetical protein
LAADSWVRLDFRPLELHDRRMAAKCNSVGGSGVQLDTCPILGVIGSS